MYKIWLLSDDMCHLKKLNSRLLMTTKAYILNYKQLLYYFLNVQFTPLTCN